jgi:hypothetical protein
VQDWQSIPGQGRDWFGKDLQSGRVLEGGCGLQIECVAQLVKHCLTARNDAFRMHAGPIESLPPARCAI